LVCTILPWSDTSSEDMGRPDNIRDSLLQNILAYRCCASGANEDDSLYLFRFQNFVQERLKAACANPGPNERKATTIPEFITTITVSERRNNLRRDCLNRRKKFLSILTATQDNT